jgi:uncharacterized membrane protein
VSATKTTTTTTTTGHNKRQHLRTIKHELQHMDHKIEFQFKSVGMEPYWSNIHF